MHEYTQGTAMSCFIRCVRRTSLINHANVLAVAPSEADAAKFACAPALQPRRARLHIKALQIGCISPAHIDLPQHDTLPSVLEQACQPSFHS